MPKLGIIGTIESRTGPQGRVLAILNGAQSPLPQR
jgi:hypothetical protein